MFCHRISNFRATSPLGVEVWRCLVRAPFGLGRLQSPRFNQGKGEFLWLLYLFVSGSLMWVNSFAKSRLPFRVSKHQTTATAIAVMCWHCNLQCKASVWISDQTFRKIKVTAYWNLKGLIIRHKMVHFKALFKNRVFLFLILGAILEKFLPILR